MFRAEFPPIPDYHQPTSLAMSIARKATEALVIHGIIDDSGDYEVPTTPRIEVGESDDAIYALRLRSCGAHVTSPIPNNGSVITDDKPSDEYVVINLQRGKAVKEVDEPMWDEDFEWQNHFTIVIDPERAYEALDPDSDAYLIINSDSGYLIQETDAEMVEVSMWINSLTDFLGEIALEEGDYYDGLRVIEKKYSSVPIESLPDGLDLNYDCPECGIRNGCDHSTHFYN